MLRIGLVALRGFGGRSTGLWTRTSHAAWQQPWQRAFSFSRAPRLSPCHHRFILRCMTRRAPSAPKRRQFHASKTTRNNKAEPESQSLGSRFRKLSQEYGWVSVGVYFALSVLDFPFCFLLVRVVGTDRIGEIEEVVVSTAQKVIPENLRCTLRGYWQALTGAFKKQETAENSVDGGEVTGWGVKEADARHAAAASFGTQLALAYAIHKSFIFVRLPLCAALVPKVTKVLRSWGWKVPRRKRRNETPKR